MLVARIVAVLACGFPVLAQAQAEHEHARSAQVLAPGYSALEYEPPAPGSYALPPLGEAADGAVISSDGRHLRLHDLFGDKLVVLSFIYTRCNDVNGCPLATFVLSRLQSRIDDDEKLRDRVRLVSLSFDPDYDTPDVLANYSKPFVSDGSDWRFVTTGSRQALAPLLESYDQFIIRDYDSEGKYLGTISHLLRVYLIDRRRRIRNIYSVSFLHADTVLNDIRTLMSGADESSPPR